MKIDNKESGFRGHIQIPITFKLEDVQEDSTIKLRADMLSDVSGQIICIDDIKNLICTDCKLRCSPKILEELNKKKYGQTKN